MAHNTLTLIARTTLLAATAAATLMLSPAQSSASTEIARRTAIPNVFAGQSSVRIANTDTRPARHEIEIYGVSERAPMGRFVLEVPAKAAIAFRPEEMIQTFAPVNWNQILVLYVETSAEGQRWQHLRHYPSGALVNASMCGPAQAVTAARPQMAMNVLTTVTSPAASFITLHNPTDAALELDARVYSARTGRVIGSVAMTLDAHETASRSGHFFQSNAGWFFPDETQFNVEFVPRTAGAGGGLIVGHMLMDVVTGQSTSLSDPCPVMAGMTAQSAP
jgi:hypothetical protein